MKLHLIMIAGLLFILSPAVLAACGSDGEAGLPPIQLQQQDRDQVTQMAADYAAALRDRDMTRARTFVTAGLPEATITKAMNTVRDQGLQFVEVTGVTATTDGATVTVSLTDNSGGTVTRSLEFKRLNGQWFVWSPHLKEPA